MESEQLTTICTEDSVYERRGNELHINLCRSRYQFQSGLWPQSCDDQASYEETRSKFAGHIHKYGGI